MQKQASTVPDVPLSPAAGRVLIIANPRSGRQLAGRHLVSVIEEASRSGVPPRAFCTGSRGDARRIARRYAAEADRIIAIGGDGTLHEVLDGVRQAGTRTPVGYVPSGTTNDMSASLSIPSNTQKAVSLALYGEASPFDCGLFGSNACFAYVASFGAFTDVSYATPQDAKNALGGLAYLAAGMQRMFDLRPIHARVTLDGEDVEGDWLFASVSNGKRVAGLLTFPADLNDGLFEVMLVRMPRNTLQIAELLTALQEKEYDQPLILCRQACEVRFAFDVPVPWTLDGEYGGREQAVFIRNLRGGFRLVHGEAPPDKKEAGKENARPLHSLPPPQ